MATDVNSLAGGVRTFVALPSSARTATPNSQEFIDLGRASAGLIVVVDTTNVTATGSLTVLIEGVDSLTGKTWTILQSAAITATGTAVLRVHPNLTAAANVTAKDIIPPRIRVTVTHLNAVSVTYSVSGHLTY